MKLRTRILAYVAAVMTIVFVMLVATLIPDMVRQTERSVAAGNAAVGALQAVLEQLDAPQRNEMLKLHPALFRDEKLLNGWVLTGSDDGVLAWMMPPPRPDKITKEIIAAHRLYFKTSFTSKSGESLQLFASITEARNPVLDFWGLFLVMAAGTALLAYVVYGLILRLVIKPIERLAATAGSFAVARGLLTQVPHTDRKDEVGDLVRAYNKMVEEVNDLKLNLEKRVSDATHNLEAAQSQIVISERLSVAGRMAAGVAHEINNPLGGMLNAARALKSKRETAMLIRHQTGAEILNPRENEYLDLILEGLGRIQGIVASMLQFSRPAKEAAAVDLGEVTDGALMFCKHRFSKMNLTLEKQYDSRSGSLKVTGHRSELGQVFLNLLVNAIDAMESNGPGPHKLTLSIQPVDNSVRVRFKDTGMGMSDEVRERAGQFFFSTKRDGQGNGLGLAIAQHIVAAHRGVMKIESAVGQGTTVELTFPKDG